MVTDEELARAAEQLCPGLRVVEVRALARDAADDGGGSDGARVDETHKSGGYGAPRRVALRDNGGTRRALVFHVATADEFGHDRRADRAAEQLLAFDTFARIPRHVPLVDVGAVTPRGLVSLRDAGELYLVTEWREGSIYADDLRRIARDGVCQPGDRERCDALARYLTGLHARKDGTPAQYRRAARDLVGSGEGIFGIRDAYGDDTPGAPRARLDAIERECLAWRGRLRERTARATTIHGDFHPFNIVFAAGSNFHLVDASRGCVGDAADDVTALAINYVFFALDQPGSWTRAFGPLWHRFWRAYLDGSGDGQLLEVVAPFLAWRGLVVCCPAFYPALPGAARDRVLTLIEQALRRPRFDPMLADEVMA
jgi:hypothetical protein